MSATKVLWGSVLVVSLIVLAAIWAATQWTAWRLGYQPQLGEPWLQVGSLRLYAPPAFFLWWFLIAQSLNQIERAYGPNHAILDNCHVRVAFATNDERTARRVSDALGMATELRAMKNYAGHRLSPWLGHLMVSRQETARPLLTAGEVMQLPPTDELVLVSGVPPIRAKKARYYEDRRLSARIMPPPSLGQGASAAGPLRDPAIGTNPLFRRRSLLSRAGRLLFPEKRRKPIWLMPAFGESPSCRSTRRSSPRSPIAYSL